MCYKPTPHIHPYSHVYNYHFNIKYITKTKKLIKW